MSSSRRPRRSTHRSGNRRRRAQSLTGEPAGLAPGGDPALGHPDGDPRRSVTLGLGRLEDLRGRRADPQSDRLDRLAPPLQVEDGAADEGARVDDEVRHVEDVHVEQLVPREGTGELVVRPAGDDLTAEPGEGQVVEEATERVGTQHVTGHVEGRRCVHRPDAQPRSDLLGALLVDVRSDDLGALGHEAARDEGADRAQSLDHHRPLSPVRLAEPGPQSGGDALEDALGRRLRQLARALAPRGR